MSAVTRCLATAQQRGEVACLVNMRGTFRAEEAAAAAVNVADLMISQPPDAGYARKIVIALLNSGAIDLIVVEGAPEGFDDDEIWLAASRTKTDLRLIP